MEILRLSSPASALRLSAFVKSGMSIFTVMRSRYLWQKVSAYWMPRVVKGMAVALLATRAAAVLGLDISSDATAHAAVRYARSRPNLSFQVEDVSALEAMPDASFDLICSFETLEHLQAQEAMLKGFRRLLAPGGLLLVSTPDKKNYSDIPGFRNEHHVRELYRDEFEGMVKAEFSNVRIYAHKLAFQSLLWSIDGDE
jgi:ubiquinone/menaquinone biosynthesis C-methylase UbiE